MALAPIPQFNQIVQSLLHIDAMNSHNGEVVNFHYRMFKHDPFPVIITTGFMSNNRVSGLNLHYLTYPIYRALLYNYAGNRAFNYFIIKNQPLIKAAFRTYRLEGVVNPKKVEWKAILAMLSVIRNYSPQELMKIREAVDKQILSRQPEILNEIFGGIYQAMQNQQG